MKTPRSSGIFKKGFTLLEMTVVIMVLLALIKIGLFTSRKMDEWRLGRNAAETLRSVYSAQRMYLADNPTAAPSTLTDAALLPYMASNASGTLAAMPTVTSLTGTTLAILVTSSPPIINAGSGVSYDPSGSTKDSLWDTGE